MFAKSLKGVPGGRGLEITTLQHLSTYDDAYLVGVVGEWVWIGLCLVEVLHTCEVPPTLVPSHLFHHVKQITVTSNYNTICGYIVKSDSLSLFAPNINIKGLPPRRI